MALKMRPKYKPQVGDRVRVSPLACGRDSPKVRNLIGTVKLRQRSNFLVHWDGWPEDEISCLPAYELEPYQDGLDVMLGLL